MSTPEEFAEIKAEEAFQEELDEASGAWGGKPDTMLRLEKLDGDSARLSFPKIRWSRRGTRRALILAFDPETESFSVAHEEEDEERDYLVEIETLLLEQPWRTRRRSPLQRRTVASARTSTPSVRNWRRIRTVSSRAPDRP